MRRDIIAIVAHAVKYMAVGQFPAILQIVTD
jgi:hypothetical protein